VDLVEVEHGDALAWHGPGQLVARPIVALPPRARDLDGYRRDLEEVVLRTLAEVEIEGERGAGGGVWVAGREVCTIDVAQRDGIAWGGLTLRLLADPPAVQALRPLGLDPARRACVEEFCELPVRTLLFEVLVVKHLCDVLDLELPPPPPPPDPGPLALFPGPGA